jgi:hypothetical protein
MIDPLGSRPAGFVLLARPIEIGANFSAVEAASLSDALAPR